MTETDMITLTIDGKEMTVEKGTTILNAALQNGIEIPHLCYHPKLAIRGTCRLCLVELEGKQKLETACSTVVGDGMVVNTNSQRVNKARQGVLEFLLINHPLNCPICDQAGECDLQKYVRDYGRKHSRYKEDKRKFDKIDIGGGIIRNMDLCVECTRCIRFARDILGIEEYGSYARGNAQQIGIYGGGELKNTMQGCMVDICPVGALTSRDFRFKQRAWFLDPKPSICLRCATGCNTYIEVKDDTIYRIRPRENTEINDIWMCDVGRMLSNDMDDKKPVTAPMMKSGGVFYEVSWDKAIERLSSEIKGAKKSPFALIIGTGASLEEMASVLLMAHDHIEGDLVTSTTRTEDITTEKESGNFLMNEEWAPNGRGAAKLGINDRTKDINERLKNGKIKGLLTIGCSIFDEGLPLKSLPHLKKAKFKAIFTDIMTPEIEESMDLVLPTPSFSQISGTYINARGITQKIEASIPIPEGVMQQNMTIADLTAELEKTEVDYEGFEKKIEARIDSIG